MGEIQTQTLDGPMDVGILYDFGWLVCIQATMKAGRMYIYIY